MSTWVFDEYRHGSRAAGKVGTYAVLYRVSRPDGQRFAGILNGKVLSGVYASRASTVRDMIDERIATAERINSLFADDDTVPLPDVQANTDLEIAFKDGALSASIEIRSIIDTTHRNVSVSPPPRDINFLAQVLREPIVITEAAREIMGDIRARVWLYNLPAAVAERNMRGKRRSK